MNNLYYICVLIVATISGIVSGFLYGLSVGLAFFIAIITVSHVIKTVITPMPNFKINDVRIEIVEGLHPQIKFKITNTGNAPANNVICNLIVRKDGKIISDEGNDNNWRMVQSKEIEMRIGIKDITKDKGNYTFTFIVSCSEIKNKIITLKPANIPIEMKKPIIITNFKRVRRKV